MEPNFFKNINSLEELKKKYRELAFVFHPDMGGDTKKMQSINIEYDFFYGIYTNETAKFKKQFHSTFWNEIPKCEGCNNHMRENNDGTWYCPTCEMNEYETREKEKHKRENTPQCVICKGYKTQKRNSEWICVYCLVEYEWIPRSFEGEWQKKWTIRHKIEKINLEKTIFGIYFDLNGKPRTDKRPARWDENNKYIHLYQSRCEKCKKYLIRGEHGGWICMNCPTKISEFIDKIKDGEFPFPEN